MCYAFFMVKYLNFFFFIYLFLYDIVSYNPVWPQTHYELNCYAYFLFVPDMFCMYADEHTHMGT